LICDIYSSWREKLEPTEYSQDLEQIVARVNLKIINQRDSDKKREDQRGLPEV